MDKLEKDAVAPGEIDQIRLIIVDQHKGVRNAWRIRLQSAPNLIIVGTVNVREARWLLQTHADIKPEVALLGLSGNNSKLHLIVEVINLLVARGTAVLALFSYIDELSRELLLQAGVSNFRLKTINTPELLSEIEALAARCRKDRLISHESSA